MHYKHTVTHTYTHTDCSRNWVLTLVRMDILWKEEGFQFGFKRWQKVMCLAECICGTCVFCISHKLCKTLWACVITAIQIDVIIIIILICRGNLWVWRTLVPHVMWTHFSSCGSTMMKCAGQSISGETLNSTPRQVSFTVMYFSLNSGRHSDSD